MKALPEKEKEILDREIAERILALPEIRESGSVFAYASLTWETGTDQILEALWREKKTIFLPRVSGETMEFFLTGSKKDLAEGTFHIMEPKAECRSTDEIAADTSLAAGQSTAEPFSAPVLVPGMAFTEQGIRLGKGGGYYDWYLGTHPSHQTIALAYEFQILDEIPAGPYDKSVDMIVTEKRVIHCKDRVCGTRAGIV